MKKVVGERVGVMEEESTCSFGPIVRTLVVMEKLVGEQFDVGERIDAGEKDFSMRADNTNYQS
jgi:hypothetical protein